MYPDFIYYIAELELNFLNPRPGTRHSAIKLILKVVPYPMTLVTSILPPIFSMIYLHILRPRPVPLWLEFWCSYKLSKFKNILSIPSCEIPYPSSMILILNLLKYKSLIFSFKIESFNERDLIPRVSLDWLLVP